MEIKILLLSLLLFISIVFLNVHQVLSSHDSAQGHEHWFGFHAIPRKLMLNSKVESFGDKDLVSYYDDLSGKSHKVGGEDATTATTLSKVSMQEGSYPTRVFTMDYYPPKKRPPVHNKSFPTTATNSP